MNDQLTDTKDFLQQISDYIHYFVKDYISDFWFVQFFFKFLFLAAAVYLLDFILKIIINFVFRFFSDAEKFPNLTSIKKSRITNSFAHLIALVFAQFALESIFYRHIKSLDLLERLVNIALVIVTGGLAFRFLKAVEYYYVIKKDHYRIVALRAISQTVKIFGIVIFSIIGICVLFNIKGTVVFGSLGAFTAVIVLVFRDTILGFVTGIHVATSKYLKNGDWIGIPKYNLEGTIEDINLLTTKIQNFDKTVSTIPTYDLLTTEIRNLQVMSETNTRRIKKSIIFNIISFKFLNDEQMEEISKINLIHDYVIKKRNEINSEKIKTKNSDEIINGKQLTNIGTFRIYALNYLKNNPHVDQNGTMLVRQLDITSQGLPLEIYCFANQSKLEEYEQIQADIFDHLLVASREFGLEVMQTKI